MSMLDFFLILVILALICPFSATVQPDPAVIAKFLTNAHISAANVIVVNKTDILYRQSFGYTSWDPLVPATDESVWLLASVSKTFIAIAVMQLEERGLVDLDASINEFISGKWSLPSVFNPNFPNDKITLRHLLTHTAGIYWNSTILQSIYYPYDNWTIEATLGEVEMNYLVPGGFLFQKTNWFQTHAPGSYYAYSNIGAALAAWIVELVTEMRYEDYIQKYILSPLNMNLSSYTLAGLGANADKVAKHYIYNYSLPTWEKNFPHLQFTQVPNNQYLEAVQFGHQPYPAGNLHSTTEALSKYLRMFMNNGTSAEGATILSAKSVKEISTVQFPTIHPAGLIWSWWDLADTQGKTRSYFGHAGTSPGTATWLLFNPATDIGVILLSNGDRFGLNDYQDQLTNQGLDRAVTYLFESYAS
jgi:CubicO group peptidase (beta-lactamase class C family)